MAQKVTRSDGVFITWPDKRFVPASTISSWYHDQVENGSVDAGIPDDRPGEQALALQEAGQITLRSK